MMTPFGTREEPIGYVFCGLSVVTVHSGVHLGAAEFTLEGVICIDNILHSRVV